MHDFILALISAIKRITRGIKLSIHSSPHAAVLQRSHFCIVPNLMLIAVGGTVQLFRALFNLWVIEKDSALTLEFLHDGTTTVVVQLR